MPLTQGATMNKPNKVWDPASKKFLLETDPIIVKRRERIAEREAEFAKRLEVYQEALANFLVILHRQDTSKLELTARLNTGPVKSKCIELLEERKRFNWFREGYIDRPIDETRPMGKPFMKGEL